MKHLKIIRTYYNFTQEQMSLLLDTSISHYSRLERGDNRKASIDLLIKVTKTFNINPCFFMCHHLKGSFYYCNNSCIFGLELIKFEDLYNNPPEKFSEIIGGRIAKKSDLLKIIENKINNK